ALPESGRTPFCRSCRESAGAHRQVSDGLPQQWHGICTGRRSSMSQFSDERGAELRELFFETAQELLQALNDGALKLEKHPKDLETVREIRRTVHTLKGDAAACSFRELSEAAHELEDALALEAIPAGSSLADVAFAAADAFNAMLKAYRHHKKPPAA